MGWFKKEEHTHFVRDKDGNVVEVQRSGGHVGKSSKQLEQEYRQSHPTKGMQRKINRAEMKQVYREEYRKAAKEATVKRARRKALADNQFSVSERFGRALGVDPFGSTFDRGVSPMRTSRKKKKGKKKTSSSNQFQKFDIFDNHGWL